jgi:bifunctional non-homologous end joining protein LigD
VTLEAYRKKRNFRCSPEPTGEGTRRRRKRGLRFVVQLHEATKRHYDFRLEIDGSLKSWAIPKGPSLDPFEKRLAVHVEDHPLDYGDFEGVIPSGNYGAGTVMIWDKGDILTDEEELKAGYAKGDLKFELRGDKINGKYALVRLKGDKSAWLLLKKRDAYATHVEVTTQDKSVVSRRSMGEIAATAAKEGKIWLSRPAVGAAPQRAAVAPKPRRPKPVPALATALKGARRGSPEPGKLARWQRALRAPASAALLTPVFDGYRAQLLLRGGSVELVSQTGRPLGRRFPRLVRALAGIDHELVLDVIVAPLDEAGEPRRRGEGGGEAHALMAYDVHHVDGRDVASLPLARRLDILAALRLPETLVRLPGDADPAALPVGAIAMLARDLKSGEAWQLRPDPVTARSARIAATGGRESEEDQGDGSLHTVVRVSGTGRAPRTIRLGNLDKVFWPEQGITKGDMLAYYKAVAPLMLPHLRDRPQSLHRHPNGIDGESFFQKEMAGHGPSWLSTATIASGRSGKVITYALVQDEASLLYLASLGCIEINTWISRVPTVNTPDYCVIDLDPGTIPFAAVIEAALEVRRVLDGIEAPSFVKTSGSRGLHIFVPLLPTASFESSRAFAELVCRRVNASLPKTTSLERSPAARPRQIYLDYLQNRIGSTMASIYSLRPRPQATVSVPLRWSEVKAGLDPTAFTIVSAPKRFDRLGDLWEGYLKSAVDVAVCHAALLGR